MVAMEPTQEGMLEEAGMQSMNDTNTHGPPADDEQAKAILLTTQYIMTIIGGIANAGTLVVLRKSGAAFSPVYLYLLKAQAIVDLCICVTGTALVLQKPQWVTGNFVFDTIVCQLWHGQFMYWTFVFYSIWNLIIIGYERYLAICKPFSHADFSPSKAYKMSAVLVIVAIIADSPGYLQIKMEDGLCVSKYLIPGEAGKMFFSLVGFWYFIVYYSGPTLIFMFLYGKVIITLVKRRDDSNLGESRLVNNAAKQMTNTAIAVTIIFVFSMSWDFWYYMLGRIGAVEYIKATLLQMVGVWLASLNSFANPFVYFLLLPAFRRSAISVFCPCAGGKAETSGDGGVSK